LGIAQQRRNEVISVSLRQNGVGASKTCADAILPKGHTEGVG
jgi:hypothetical protein